MTAVTWLAALALGSGAWMVLLWVRARRPGVAQRVAPYVRAEPAEEIRLRAVTTTPWPTLERLLAPAVRDAARVLARYAGPASDVSRRLRRAGSGTTVEQFRAQQVLAGCAGLVAGLGLATFLALTRGAGLVPLTVLVGVATATGVLVRDLALSRAVATRERRLTQELPTIAELLALAVSAGESATAALERVARITRGPMSDELRIALADCRAGARLPDALHSMAKDAGVAALARFAEGIATAMERGTPLAAVLRAQAADVRAQGREALIEEGGKRELAMLVPVVFLILPITIVFAVYPGLLALRLS
ncbi:type II secretion system F family protein [Demequina globuliformis]|uniref:type II secretion system F family protein n=1 Tax=Demequina globuliformis TaxID=676202 RepID=UPI000AD9E67B|nr:type II secretion system F family protein [Demequina globuliformis]